MKKRIKKNKLNVKASHSKAVLRNLFDSLITYGKLETTQKRAKTLKSYADLKIGRLLVSKSEKVDNFVVKELGSKKAAHNTIKYVNFLRKQGRDSKGGFVSLVRTRYRKGDNSLMIEVSLINFEDYKKAIKPPKKVLKTKKVKPSQKPATSVKKEVKKEVKKPESKKPVVEDVQKKGKEGFFAKLGERFLGKKTQGPGIDRTGRARSRSGI